MARINLFFAALLTAGMATSSSAQDYSNYVDLPEGDFLLKPGNGADLVEAYCTACHSVAPIVQHPGFDQVGWDAEIEKMQNRYGAYVDESEVDALTVYLTDSYGDPAESHWSAGPADVASD